MKRLATLLALMFFTLYSFAQTPSLRGTWKNETKGPMGAKTIETYVFYGDTEGKVYSEAKAIIDANFFGVTLKGDYSLYCTGVFSYDGETLEMNWDKDSFHYSYSPITLNYKAQEVSEDMRAELEKSLKEMDKLMKEEMEEEIKRITEEELNIRYPCTMKNDKLVLSTKDENGKTVKEKFTLVQ